MSGGGFPTLRDLIRPLWMPQSPDTIVINHLGILLWDTLFHSLLAVKLQHPVHWALNEKWVNWTFPAEKLLHVLWDRRRQISLCVCFSASSGKAAHSRQRDSSPLSAPHPWMLGGRAPHTLAWWETGVWDSKTVKMSDLPCSGFTPSPRSMLATSYCIQSCSVSFWEGLLQGEICREV